MAIEQGSIPRGRHEGHNVAKLTGIVVDSRLAVQRAREERVTGVPFELPERGRNKPAEAQQNTVGGAAQTEVYHAPTTPRRSEGRRTTR